MLGIDLTQGLQDPDLWWEDGDCLVYLYAQGQSQRGPSFRIPFPTLLQADCFPLIERFLAPEADRFRAPWGRRGYATSQAPRKLELYIPPPPGMSKADSFAYHLSTRNFIAWVYRRPLVGGYLGETLAELFGCMQELRRPDVDNLVDIIDYMEGQGYMDMRNDPYTAIAVLHLAESFRLKGMYVDAFTHCVGMFSQLDQTPGYHLVSEASKKLLSKAKADLDSRLGRASAQLRDFARDDLVLSFGMPRAHVDKIRDFLLGFYSLKFGKYPPPPSSKGGGLDKDVYHTMRNDFECLRQLLVDERSTHKSTSKRRAEADVIRILTAYDFQRGHDTLQNPLPLLPSAVPRRPLWKRLLNRNDKRECDDRLLAHATLVRAYNGTDQRVVRNDLVRAYRLFEEDEAAAEGSKASLREGRMACWVVVYAVCQALRHVTEAPREVFDTDGVGYHVAVSTAGVPPWEAEEEGQDGGGFGKPEPAAAGGSTPGNGNQAAPRRRQSFSHTAKSLSKSFRTPSMRRPLSMFTAPPERAPHERAPHVQLHPIATPPATSQSSQDYETVRCAQDTHTDPSPSLRDSATTASSTELETPQSSPTRSRPPVGFPTGKPRVRAVVSMLPTEPSHFTASSTDLCTLQSSPTLGRPEVTFPSGKPRVRDVVSMLEHGNYAAVKPAAVRKVRPRSAVMSSPEVGAWASEVPGYAVDYAALADREREAVFG